MVLFPLVYELLKLSSFLDMIQEGYNDIRFVNNTYVSAYCI